MSATIEFHAIDTPAGTILEPCPVCASAAALWRRSEDPSGRTHVAACCTHAQAIGPQDAALMEGCPMYFPGEEFYRNRIADAAKFWNEFAKATGALQRKNRWERAQVLRGLASQPDTEKAE